MGDGDGDGIAVGIATVCRIGVSGGILNENFFPVFQ
jgi:hypothetical protein